MQDEHRFALMLSRLLELLQQDGGDDEERRGALHAIVGFVNDRSATLRLESSGLSVEGVNVPRDIPFVRTFIARMMAHKVGEIRIAHRAAPIDLMELLQGLGRAPEATSLKERLAAMQVTSVEVVDPETVDILRARRAVRVTDALLGIKEGSEEVQDPFADSKRATPRGPPADFVPAKAGAAYGQMVELTQASKTTLSAAVERLKGTHDGPELSKGLNAVAAGVVTAIRDQRIVEAIDAIIAVIRQEGEEKREDVRLRYGVALRRILQPEVLQPLMQYLLDPLYAQDVAAIMRRAGARATELLLDLLVSAPTFAERRAFLEALRHIDQGGELLVAMLNHHEWYVVRNIADLVGELQIEEGVPALGDAAKHEDKRVRLSAGLALARIGTPSAVKFLGNILRDPEAEVRLEVARQVRGRGLGALAMPLVTAADQEEEDEVREEFFRALGRIGSPDAVQALIKASKPGGLLSGRRKGRVAATEGLGLAGGRQAEVALRELSDDRDKHVREAAHTGLETIRAQRSDSG